MKAETDPLGRQQQTGTPPGKPTIQVNAAKTGLAWPARAAGSPAARLFH
jgi:hypothetical protein